VKANRGVSEAERLPDNELIAQMGYVSSSSTTYSLRPHDGIYDRTIVFAGTDTSSSILSRILQLLSTDTKVQERLRAELTMNPVDTIDYNTLMGLPLLDAICKETLRLYAPTPFRNRRFDMLSHPC
jgi:cytochrome P450